MIRTTLAVSVLMSLRPSHQISPSYKHSPTWTWTSEYIPEGIYVINDLTLKTLQIILCKDTVPQLEKLDEWFDGVAFY